MYIISINDFRGLTNLYLVELNRTIARQGPDLGHVLLLQQKWVLIDILVWWVQI